MVNAAFNRKKSFTGKLDLNVRKKLVKWYIWNKALYGAMESRSEIPGKFRNEEVLRTVKEERKTLHTVKSRKAN
jgi:hypothetical protein